MEIVHSPISCASACEGNRPRETLRFQSNWSDEGWIPSDNEDMSPNPERGELDSASLHKPMVAKLPDLLKPAIYREEMNKSTCRTIRGDWRERVLKECTWQLGSPSRRLESVVDNRQGTWGSHNLESPRRRVADRPVVTTKQGNACGVKESARYLVFKLKGGAA